jgi:DNA polymerase-3 subunit gamma/tau
MRVISNFSRMDNFIVSARKYRPENFASVVGQSSITGTLKSAIQKKQLGHAYLFCGPRGVGKTTCARIFAKTINCMNLGADAEPCNSCESCLSFNESRAFNIHELDAASNNSVEDIRNLTEQVRIPPQVGLYSIYIIDEVHMLSASAFNAFLKTLEEPPAHAVFILATTEKHKIIPTILSRCQIFDFNRIRVEDIVKYLEYISGQEGIEYEPDAFNVIALKADGAMRDALSIFDQMVSFSGKTISYKDVIDNLNILDYEYYFRLTDTCLSGMSGETLMIFDEILAKGFDAHNFLSGFSSHLRDLLVSQDEVTLKLLEVGAGIREKYRSQAKQLGQEWLYTALDVLGTADVSFKSSRNQRLHVELALLRCCRLQGDPKKKALSSKTEIAENNPDEVQSVTEDKRVAKADPEKVDISTPESPTQADEISKADPEPEAGTEPDPDVKTEPEPAVKTDPKPEAGTEPDPDVKTEPEPAVKTEQESKPEPEPEPVPEPEPEPVPEPEAGKIPPSTTQRSSRRGPGDLPSIKDAINGVHKKKTDDKDEEEKEKKEIPVLTNPFTQDDLIKHWHAFTDSIKDEKPRMANSLKHHLPLLGDALQIELELSNSAQLEEFIRDIKPDLIGYLQKVLQNNQFKLLPIVSEEEEQKNTLYTSEEKYDHMLKKNPELGKLKERFNLDFE